MNGKLQTHLEDLSRFRPFLAAALFASIVPGCATSSNPGSGKASVLGVPGDPDAPSQVSPSEALAIARSYADHAWTPFARNLRHGHDRDGVLVNTPDVTLKDPPDRPGWWIPGEVNRGVPYKWGGFDSLQSFDRAIADGLAGGDVSSAAKRRADDAAVSREACGVDCSGFVSRCLKLPRVHDTSLLPTVCDTLDDVADLRPGDLLNIPRGHVVLCAGWARPDRSWIYFYDTGAAPDYWRPSLKEAPLDELVSLGYQPLRYRGMAEEPGLSGKEVLTRAVRSNAIVVPKPTIGEP